VTTPNLSGPPWLARARQLEGVLREISEKLQCDEPCIDHPPKACVTCQHVEYGQWCAGCVARTALASWPAADEASEPGDAGAVLSKADEDSNEVLAVKANLADVLSMVGGDAYNCFRFEVDELKRMIWDTVTGEEKRVVTARDAERDAALKQLADANKRIADLEGDLYLEATEGHVKECCARAALAAERSAHEATRRGLERALDTSRRLVVALNAQLAEMTAVRDRANDKITERNEEVRRLCEAAGLSAPHQGEQHRPREIEERVRIIRDNRAARQRQIDDFNRSQESWVNRDRERDGQLASADARADKAEAAAGAMRSYLTTMADECGIDCVPHGAKDTLRSVLATDVGTQLLTELATLRDHVASLTDLNQMQQKCAQRAVDDARDRPAEAREGDGEATRSHDDR
jgi:hypothetical protein